ncbi:MAG: molybdopterin-dependent oxidoreductase [Betaproteobacteria bacterium]|nr:molybdopterin-dependent oxidoreductase [Betaproteobacteria bacterium]
MLLNVNGEERTFRGAADTPLLWVLRDALGLKGTKYGCGVGVCGSCIVLIDGEPRHACTSRVDEVSGKSVVTIEGFARKPEHPVIQAWIAEQVPQCGYCHPAQVLTAAWLLGRHPHPSDAEIDNALSPVLCRCGSYPRIRRAVRRAAEMLAGKARHSPCSTAALCALPAAGPGDAEGYVFNPWVRIARDGTITVVIDRSEMGQGAITGLAMLAAEELEADLDRIRVEYAPAADEYSNALLGEQMTGGSTSIRNAWKTLREAGASVRVRLIAAAAKAWGVKRVECHAERGEVVHGTSGRRIGYGTLAAIAVTQPAPRRVLLKSPQEFRLIGRSLPRIEVPDLVLGRAVYAIDVTRPGLLHAVLARSPSFGGRVASYDASEALRVPGVRNVIEIGGAVAVIADDVPAALKGRDALKIDWNIKDACTLDSDAIRNRLIAALERRGSAARDEGDAARALKQASHVVEALYETPYLAHATMEPMNCIAEVRDDGCDIWVGTQAQEGAQRRTMDLTGLPRERVRVHTTYLGGGFGRRLESDFVAEAVQVARIARRPVQVLWTRADDMRHDFYRPASVTAFRAGIDARGAVIAWLQRVAGPGLALDGIDMPYAIANVREVHINDDPGVPTGAWRSVGASQNAYTIECFVDELAAATEKDPLAFRLALLKRAPHYRAVLELAADRAGWDRTPPEGRSRGIAVYRCFGSWVAQVAEVSVAEKGALRVERVVCAADCGTLINPDAAAAQMEGGIIFGLSAALHGRITLHHGAVMQSSFEDYPLVTMRDAPEIEVHFVNSRHAPGGVGEPGVPPIAPAVANAVFAATGRRIRRLPLFAPAES